MFLVLALALAASGPPYLNGGIGRAQDDPNVVLRVLPGGPPATALPPPGAYTLAGSFGENLSFTRATSATCTPASGTVYTVASGVPCLTEQGYRADPQAINLLLQSGSPANAVWSKTTITVGAPTTPGPDGVAVNLIQDAATTLSAYQLQQVGINVVGGTVYSLSVYAKQRDWRYIQLAAGDTACHYANFDLQTQTATASQSSVTGASVTTYGSGANGFARYTMSWTGGANVNSNMSFLTLGADSNSCQASHTGVVGSGVWASLFQVEAGSSSTSYIPTLGSAVQRNGEVLNAVKPATLTTAEGCLSADVTLGPGGNFSGNDRLIGLDGANTGLMFNAGVGTTTQIAIWDNSSFTNILGTALAGRTAHISGWWSTALNQKVACLDGVCSAPGAYSNQIASGTNINIGSNAGVGSQPGAKIANIVVGSSRFACPP